MPGMTFGADRDGLEEISSAPPRGGGPEKRIYLDGFHPVCHQGAISQRLTGLAVSSRLGSRLSRQRTHRSKQAPLMNPRAAALAAARPIGILDSALHRAFCGAVCFWGTAALFV